jgi:hypothetical protein
MRYTATLLIACIARTLCYSQPPADFSHFNMANTPSVFTSNNFKTIAIDRFGSVWAGTQYGGLYIFSGATSTWSKSSLLSNVFINDIKADPKGGVWVAQSGIMGASASEGNRQGAVSFFADETFSSIADYGVDAIGLGGLNSRNVRAIWVDTATVNKGELGLPRVWATQATFLTNSNTTAGGIAMGTNPAGSWKFNKIKKGLQIFPNTNIQSTGTPSCDAIGGNRHEVWISVRTNYGGSDILRFDPKNGNFLGGYDETGAYNNKRRIYKDVQPNYTSSETKDILQPGFRLNAIHFDGEGRKWLGMANTGLVVVEGSVWTKPNLSNLLADGYSINNNAIAEDEEGNVFFGTTAGILMYKAGENVYLSSSYQLITINNGLPSNNVTGVCADTKNQRILITTDAGISFWNRKKPVSVNLEWDFSFPRLATKPRGVVGDGVSRVYMKIKKANENLPDIKNVELFIKDYNNAQANIRGKLKRATVLDRYSEEASTNTSAEVSRTDASSEKEFWFWYVAPDDFSNTADGIYSNEPERRDSIKIRVTYANDTKDSSYYGMRISRPPLLLVHGLASGPSTYDLCHPDNIAPYITNPKFKYCKALTMDGKGLFKDNAARLLSGDGADQDAKDNSLQGNLEEMHIRGFAANQVDYVCHSMGGIMLRGAYGWYNDKFMANGNYRYNNYGKGFVHKAITVNTPHNSSPVADLVHDFTPSLNQYQRGLLTYVYRTNPKIQIPFDFVQPDPATVNQNEMPFEFRPSDAVSNLQVRVKTGGINLPQTNLKHHLIAGDVDISQATISELEKFNFFAKIVSMLLENYRHEYSAEKVGVDINFDENVTELQRMIYFFNLYSSKLDYPNFTQDGDLIVPLGSQLIRQSTGLSHISLFKNLPGTVASANHIEMLPRDDVGKKIFDLLNEPVNNNPHFADILPANSDPEPEGVFGSASLKQSLSAPTQHAPNISVSYDTTKVRIISPTTNGSSFADSALTVQFRLKDTVGLAYLKLDFQETTKYRRNRNSLQQISLTVKPSYTGTQTVYLAVVYDKPNGVEYHIDTIHLLVENKAVLQDFRIVEDEATVVEGIPFFPTYEVQFNDHWIPLPNGLADVQVTIDSAQVSTYDPIKKQFVGTSKGAAVATVTYKGFEDEIVLNVLPSRASACTNTTIAAGSFKNPTIWSKGIIPDICDSVTIAHAVTVDTSIQISSLRINSGAALTLSNAQIQLKLGSNDEGQLMLNNFGSLNISNGTISIHGRLKHNANSTFNMTGGTLILDGNTGITETAVLDGLPIFEAAPNMQNFAFTGGTLQIVDPALGSSSQTISCSYDFGANSTLILGNGKSTTVSNNTSGFGGTLFPNKIGKLIIDAAIRTGNRQFITKKPLTVKGTLQVKSGSGLTQEAALRVEP